MTDIKRLLFGIALILFAIFLCLLFTFMSGENVWTALFAVAGLIFAIAGIDGVAQTKKSSEEKDTPALDEQPKE